MKDKRIIFPDREPISVRQNLGESQVFTFKIIRQ